MYDSPNVAYSCGNVSPVCGTTHPNVLGVCATCGSLVFCVRLYVQTFPWYGTDELTFPELPELLQCGVKPNTCEAKNYYR